MLTVDPRGLPIAQMPINDVITTRLPPVTTASTLTSQMACSGYARIPPSSITAARPSLDWTPFSSDRSSKRVLPVTTAAFTITSPLNDDTTTSLPWILSRSNPVKLRYPVDCAKYVTWPGGARSNSALTLVIDDSQLITI